MGYWGWRPLVFCTFISVLIIGCTGTRVRLPAASSTESPPITLQVRTPATLTPFPTPGLPVVATSPTMATASKSLTPHASFDPRTTPTPYPVDASPPTCYAQRDTGVLCLGEVFNPGNRALARVVVRVTILNVNGDALRVQQVTLPRRNIPAAEAAAYSALFVPGPDDGVDGLAGQFGGVMVAVIRAEQVNTVDSPALTVLDAASTLRGGRVVVGGALRNDDTVVVTDIRLFVTVYDGLERVTGFRVAQLPDLDPGSEHPFSVAVAAQNRVEPYRYRITIEAQRDNLR